MASIDEKLTAQLGYSPFLDSALIQFDKQILLATAHILPLLFSWFLTNLVEANLVHFSLMPGSLNETCYASAESGISVLVKRVLTDHIGNS